MMDRNELVKLFSFSRFGLQDLKQEIGDDDVESGTGIPQMASPVGPSDAVGETQTQVDETLVAGSGDLANMGGGELNQASTDPPISSGEPATGLIDSTTTSNEPTAPAVLADDVDPEHVYPVNGDSLSWQVNYAMLIDKPPVPPGSGLSQPEEPEEPHLLFVSNLFRVLL